MMPGHDVLYSAVFETFSSINHRCCIFTSFRSACPGTDKRGAASCCPNAMFRWDRGIFSGEIQALRPLSAGEEITISYFQGIMEPGAVTQERQMFLLECYSFECECPVCGRSQKERDHNDKERSIIATSMAHIGEYYREEVREREMIFYPTY